MVQRFRGVSGEVEEVMKESAFSEESHARGL